MAHDTRNHLHKLLKKFDHAMLVSRAPEGGVQAISYAFAAARAFVAGARPSRGLDRHAKVKL